jgi:hypothetical protein
MRAKSITQVSVGSNSGCGLCRMSLSLAKTKRFPASSCWLRKEGHLLTCVNKNSEQSGRNDWIGYDERMIARVFFFFTYLAFKICLQQIPTNSR